MTKDMEAAKKRLMELVEKELPEIVEAIREYIKRRHEGGDDKMKCVLMHQDSFAADYQKEEYALLGMAIKYAGEMGVPVMFTGKNRETVGKK